MTDKDQVTGGHEVEQQVDEASMAPTGHSDVQIEQAMSWDCAGSRAVINGGVSSPDFGNDADEGKGARGQIPSVYDLMAAHQRPSASCFTGLRALYESQHDCTVEEEYYARHAEAAALLAKSKPTHERSRFHGKPRSRSSYAISYYYGGGADPKVDNTIRSLHVLHLVNSTILEGRFQAIAARRIFVDLVTLLNTIDACKNPRNHEGHEDKVKRVQAGIKSANDDVEETRAFIQDLRRRVVLKQYLIGFPFGILAAVVLAVLASRIPGPSDGGLIVGALSFGAIGAIVSVMVRITRGQDLFVDTHEGRTITLIAGAFRPIIGAVFGSVMYVFTVGGLLPFVSIPPNPDNRALFFMGLAFLAGFSERWAQDTIIQSAPKAPSSLRGPRVSGKRTSLTIPDRSESRSADHI